MRVTCSESPNLSIPHLGVRFVDGVAEVSEEIAAALSAYAVHGVTVPVGSTPKRPVTRRKTTAKE